MSSLKGYVPKLAQFVGTTPAALYERQRALVRAGLLDQGASRGPGSGVRATANSVAMLLVSILATDRLTETEDRVALIATATYVGPEGQCPLTGQKLFVEALSFLLEDQKRSAVLEVSVSRTAHRAQIRFLDTDGSEVDSTFIGSSAHDAPITVTASLMRERLIKIAEDLDAVLLTAAGQQEVGNGYNS